MPENVITSSDLKSILHSGCANIYSQEKYLIQVNGGHVEYITQDEENSFYWNIPITNTIAIMSGASVTQMAMRELPRAGVMVGFCRKDGTSLYFANEVNQHCEDWPERQLNADWNSLSHKPEKSGWSIMFTPRNPCVPGWLKSLRSVPTATDRPGNSPKSLMSTLQALTTSPCWWLQTCGKRAMRRRGAFLRDVGVTHVDSPDQTGAAVGSGAGRREANGTECCIKTV